MDGVTGAGREGRVALASGLLHWWRKGDRGSWNSPFCSPPQSLPPIPPASKHSPGRQAPEQSYPEALTQRPQPLHSTSRQT